MRIDIYNAQHGHTKPDALPIHQPLLLLKHFIFIFHAGFSNRFKLVMILSSNKIKQKEKKKKKKEKKKKRVVYFILFYLFIFFFVLF